MSKVLWSLTNTFLNRGFSTVFSIVLANLLSPTEIGIYVSVMMVVTYSTNMLSFQIGSGVAQKLNDQRLTEWQSHYFTGGFLATSAIALTIISALYLGQSFAISIFALEGNETLYLFTVPLIFFSMKQGYFNRVLQANLRLKSLTAVQTISVVLQIGGTLLLVLAGYGVYGVIIGRYLRNIVFLLGAGYLIPQTYSFLFAPTLFGITKDLLKFSGLIQLGATAVFLDGNVDKFLVNAYLPKDDLAIYNYASSIAYMFVVFGGSISVVSFPKLTRSFSSDNLAAANRLYALALNFSFLIISITALAIMLNAELIIGLILPPVYLAMVTPLIILLLAMVLFSMFNSVGSTLTARGIPGYAAPFTWLALGANVLLCLLLIPPYGIVGAAVATATSFVLRVLVGMAIIEYKIRTHYNYGALGVAYGLLVAFVLIGRLATEMLWIRAGLLGIYIILTSLMMIRADEKAYLKNFLRHWQRRGLQQPTASS